MSELLTRTDPLQEQLDRLSAVHLLKQPKSDAAAFNAIYGTGGTLSSVDFDGPWYHNPLIGRGAREHHFRDSDAPGAVVEVGFGDTLDYVPEGTVKRAYIQNELPSAEATLLDAYELFEDVYKALKPGGLFVIDADWREHDALLAPARPIRHQRQPVNDFLSLGIALNAAGFENMILDDELSNIYAEKLGPPSPRNEPSKLRMSLANTVLGIITRS